MPTNKIIKLEVFSFREVCLVRMMDLLCSFYPRIILDLHMDIEKIQYRTTVPPYRNKIERVV